MLRWQQPLLLMLLPESEGGGTSRKVCLGETCQDRENLADVSKAEPNPQRA